MRVVARRAALDRDAELQLAERGDQGLDPVQLFRAGRRDPDGEAVVDERPQRHALEPVPREPLRDDVEHQRVLIALALDPKDELGAAARGASPLQPRQLEAGEVVVGPRARRLDQRLAELRLGRPADLEQRAQLLYARRLQLVPDPGLLQLRPHFRELRVQLRRGLGHLARDPCPADPQERLERLELDAGRLGLAGDLPQLAGGAGLDLDEAPRFRDLLLRHPQAAARVLEADREARLHEVLPVHQRRHDLGARLAPCRAHLLQVDGEAIPLGLRLVPLEHHLVELLLRDAAALEDRTMLPDGLLQVLQNLHGKLDPQLGLANVVLAVGILAGETRRGE
ncbi:MAG: hypothetical protein ACYTGK_13350 [Planctomycetota bacterium]